ncbi:BrnA antitoxin family protein [uncultured Lamprocystis sp.]|jgi:uncharacterized protein (DUF4415 family)|uniref:BrnA antitoxin family protein n=1 Tax=uncultured Lamprocystis sp. TaxID=543132 RepID=UPI0025DBF2F9|nr:BrnA antitoxin family protein [uncultured Lamprocystis sp.]
MKSDTLPKGFPVGPEDWEKLITEAPGEDRPPTQAETAARRNAVVVCEGGIPAIRAALAARRRGSQRAPTKVPTTIRFDADVLTALKLTGKGWQTRVNDAMREWIKDHSPDGTGTHR